VSMEREFRFEVGVGVEDIWLFRTLPGARVREGERDLEVPGSKEVWRGGKRGEASSGASGREVLRNEGVLLGIMFCAATERSEDEIGVLGVNEMAKSDCDGRAEDGRELD